MDIRLRRLESVELRRFWASEDGDFTKWLAQPENLQLLSQTLGFELQLVGTEEHIGDFRADILCKDPHDASWIIIENQFGKTDHKHLGKLLTYAAILQATKVIWIAQSFLEEHRIILEWLNMMANYRVRFYGVEIELWQIGHALPLPQFNVVCQANMLSPSSHETIMSKNAERMLLDFWTQFAERIKAHKGH